MSQFKIRIVSVLAGWRAEIRQVDDPFVLPFAEVYGRTKKQCRERLKIVLAGLMAVTP